MALSTADPPQRKTEKLRPAQPVCHTHTTTHSCNAGERQIVINYGIHNFDSDTTPATMSLSHPSFDPHKTRPPVASHPAEVRRTPCRDLLVATIYPRLISPSQTLERPRRSGAAGYFDDLGHAPYNTRCGFLFVVSLNPCTALDVEEQHRSMPSPALLLSSKKGKGPSAASTTPQAMCWASRFATTTTKA